MIRVLKKTALIALIIMGISFVASLVCIPLAVKGAINDINRITSEIDVPVKTISVSPDIKNIEFTSLDYMDVEFKQASGKSAYIEVYTSGYTGRYNSDIDVTESNDTAYVAFTREYGKFKFDKKYIEAELAKEFQNYPDAVIYIPVEMNVICQGSIAQNILSSNVSFANRNDIIAQIEAEEIQQQNEQMQMNIEEVYGYMEEKTTELENMSLNEIENIRGDIAVLREELDSLREEFYSAQ